MMPTPHAGQDELDSVWKALADPTRRQILDLLRERPRTVGELCRPFAPGLTRFAVMKHLGVLKDAGLVVDRKEGRERWNHLNAVPLRRIYERWVTRYESAWAGALLGLERHVRAQEREGNVMAKSSGVVKEGSFHIEQEVEIAAPPEKVFEALLDPGAWWCHHFGQSSSRMILEPHPGGRFYEQSADTQALFGVVTYLKRPSTLRLSGPLGMSRLPVNSVYEYALEPKGSGTILKLSHRAVGLLDAEWYQAHDEGWKQLWVHLKAFAETGKRYSPA